MYLDRPAMFAAHIRSGILGPRALDEVDLASGPAVLLSEFSYKRGMEIYGENEPADYVYQVKEGAVRSYKLLSDGRRQIGAFHLVGDIFGVTSGENHRFTTEAIEDTTLRVIRRRKLVSMATTDAVLARKLLNLTAMDLRHAEDHLLLLGRKDALERVATFLLEMDMRLATAGVMTLPMARHDIADYLGLTVETVSRSLSRLRKMGALEFTGETQRELTILSRDRLRALDLQG